MDVGDEPRLAGLARHLVSLLVEREETVAIAESLTGGQVGAVLTEVAGVSAVFRGGITAYATELKSSLLDVDVALLDEYGPVSAEVAAAMARGVRRRLGAGYGLATTGVAGPDPQGDQRPGTVYLAVSSAAADRTERMFFSGDRAAVRRQATGALLEMAGGILATSELRSPASGT